MGCASGNNSLLLQTGQQTSFFNSQDQEKRWNTSYWYAVYTKSRHEKVLDQGLKKRGIETFLPLRKISRQWSDRKKVIEDPLFKSYLFVRIPWRDRLEVLKTTGAVRFIGSRHSDPTVVPEIELLTIRRFIEEQIRVDPFPYLKQGERVYVRSGLLKGAEGFIVRKNRNCRLVISLDLLMQSVSVELDEACVEPF